MITTSLLSDTTRLDLRPRFEGANICTWIGFKHVNYLVEEAVLAHFREAGLSARHLFEEHGLGLDLVDLDTRIPRALHLDDAPRAEVVPVIGSDEPTLGFAVTLTVPRGDRVATVATSKVRVALRRDDYLAPAGAPPAELAQFVVPHLGAATGEADAVPAPDPGGTTGADPVLDQLTRGRNAFGWKWRIPYPYCHFTERVQLSGYLRIMEEVVELFLADRGISIRDLLLDRRWIPVVPHSRVQLLGETLMEEDLYTVYTVEEVFKDFTYTARMDCYVLRDGRLTPTATGRITHGYAVIENRADWRLVNFDERVLRALAGPAGETR